MYVDYVYAHVSNPKIVKCEILSQSSRNPLAILPGVLFPCCHCRTVSFRDCQKVAFSFRIFAAVPSACIQQKM